MLDGCWMVRSKFPPWCYHMLPYIYIYYIISLYHHRIETPACRATLRLLSMPRSPDLLLQLFDSLTKIMFDRLPQRRITSLPGQWCWKSTCSMTKICNTICYPKIFLEPVAMTKKGSPNSVVLLKSYFLMTKNIRATVTIQYIVPSHQSSRMHYRFPSLGKPCSYSPYIPMCSDGFSAKDQTFPGFLWHFQTQHNQAKFSDVNFLHGAVATTSTTTTTTSQPPLSNHHNWR